MVDCLHLTFSKVGLQWPKVTTDGNTNTSHQYFLTKKPLRLNSDNSLESLTHMPAEKGSHFLISLPQGSSYRNSRRPHADRVLWRRRRRGALRGGVAVIWRRELHADWLFLHKAGQVLHRRWYLCDGAGNSSQNGRRPSPATSLVMFFYGKPH